MTGDIYFNSFKEAASKGGAGGFTREEKELRKFEAGWGLVRKTWVQASRICGAGEERALERLGEMLLESARAANLSAAARQTFLLRVLSAHASNLKVWRQGAGSARPTLDATITELERNYLFQIMRSAGSTGRGRGGGYGGDGDGGGTKGDASKADGKGKGRGDGKSDGKSDGRGKGSGGRGGGSSTGAGETTTWRRSQIPGGKEEFNGLIKKWRDKFGVCGIFGLGTGGCRGCSWPHEMPPADKAEEFAQEHGFEWLSKG